MISRNDVRAMAANAERIASNLANASQEGGASDLEIADMIDSLDAITRCMAASWPHASGREIRANPVCFSRREIESVGLDPDDLNTY